ncbi:FdhF/YdeP family oxidoreductase [Sphingomonas bacterium]|uniref:FdhF/YdeP family oxidoreductase n=1 Tax=Sphingomonas bacterium TaxID=1895847 RepID=UPI0015773E7A|nr:FdhF/YdeP family oxidoreductase [Sphingomonas bacterium]
MSEKVEIKAYTAPAGGWGSMKGLSQTIRSQRAGPETIAEWARQNKPDGFMCVSCAWGKPAHPTVAEFCENGGKATAWEITRFRTTPAFFQKHRVGDLLSWSDHDLEQAGRLTHPMRYDAGSDRYLAVSWEEAFAEIGAKLKTCDPKKVIAYASGRASLETSYMWALFARLHGHQNLPDSSNMCHETTSVGLRSCIGSPVGTIHFTDYEKCDAIFYFGQNPGVNSPRFLRPLAECHQRGVDIVVFNPLKERGLERFTDPQSPVEMLTGKSTPIASQYHQVKAGGDIAALLGMIKHVVHLDDRAHESGAPAVIDHGFIGQHTRGFDAVAQHAREADWAAIEHESGLTRDALESAAAIYARAKAVICVYGMGLTQHVHGITNLQMLVNFMLLRGNVGKPGAGFGPVRGHSNVQGQRTVGITEKTELVPVEQLKKQFGFDPPTDEGWDTVGACEALVKREVQAFVALGGNFARAIPDHRLTEPAWADVDLTVHIATKLNRSHLLTGRTCYLLPCLGRIELDRQKTGSQTVTMEDSFSRIYGSRGRVEPAADTLLSEPAIIAGIARATLPPNPKVPWEEWVADYSLVRDAIETTYPDQFARFNERLHVPGGFWKGVPAAHRQWTTPSGRAEFNVPKVMNSTGFEDQVGRMRLVTLRSNDQFNTTIYGYDDRFRGIKGTRQVALMNRLDLVEMGLRDGETVHLVGDHGDNADARVEGLRVVAYDIPRGCVGGYYPECNPLIPVAHHAEESHVPAAKSVPVRVERAA